jgi:uncharacterized protein (TIGR03086 family)
MKVGGRRMSTYTEHPRSDAARRAALLGTLRGPNRATRARCCSSALLGREFWLPEIRGGVTLPAPVGISFHLVDYVVHSWDVARSIDVPVSFDDQVLAVVLPIAEQVPDGANRPVPGAAFKPGIEATSGTTFDRVLALLGRSPEWSRPSW